MYVNALTIKYAVKQVSLLAFTFLACMRCASTVASYNVEFDQDVTVFLENDQTKLIKHGEKVDLPAVPVSISREGHKTVVLLPVPSQEGTLHVRLPKETANAESVGRVDGATANKIAQAVIEVQSLLVEKRADESLAKIQNIRDRYPGFSYLRFLEASCFMIKNDFEKARELTAMAMEEFPDDIAGREFMTKLNGQSGSAGAGTLKGEADDQ